MRNLMAAIPYIFYKRITTIKDYSCPDGFFFKDVRQTSPSLFPSFSTRRRMGVTWMLCNTPSGNEKKK
jgi:hypothetical protein